MIGYSILSDVFNKLLTDKLVTKIYTDVFIMEENGNRYPVYPDGAEFKYVGVDDTKVMICYFRQLGEARNAKTIYVDSALKSYLLRVPFRMVLFNDYETRNFDELTVAFMNVMFAQFLDFTALITDVKKIQQEENLIKNFTFDASTYYVAIDFTLSVEIFKNNCAEVIGCAQVENPICKV